MNSGKLSQEEKEKLAKFLKPNEKVLLAFAFGKGIFEPRWQGQTGLDYCLFTNNGLLVVRNVCFTENKEHFFCEFPDITAVDVREQAMGCTITIKSNIDNIIKDEVLENCPKREGEQLVGWVNQVMGKFLCSNCMRPALKEFLYCPYCEFKLKELCSKCGKEKKRNWKICPYCGEGRNKI